MALGRTDGRTDGNRNRGTAHDHGLLEHQKASRPYTHLILKRACAFGRRLYLDSGKRVLQKCTQRHNLLVFAVGLAQQNTIKASFWP